MTRVNTQSRFIELFGEPLHNTKHWAQQRLDSLGILERGVSKARPRNASYLMDGPYPLVQTGEVANCDTYITDYLATYSEAGLAQSKLWPSGTLCITIAANIAKTGILTFDACFPDSIVGFIPNQNVDIIYIYYWFKSVQSFLEDLAPSTAQKNINLGILSQMQVILPPLKEQKLFTSFVQQADKSKFNDFKSRFIEMFGNKPSVSIQSIAKEVFAGGDKPSDISNVKTEEYKYPVFSNGIGENALLCYSKSFRVSVPAITVSARGTIGYAEIRNAHFTPVVRLLTLIPKENNNLTFVKYALNQIEYRTSGSSIGQLPVPEFIKLTVPAASITEQDRFSSIAEQADKSKYLS